MESSINHLIGPLPVEYQRSKGIDPALPFIRPLVNSSVEEMYLAGIFK
ncbi:Uncharacterized protein AC511_0546 [Pseudomonas coronafaciens pv. oryzae]|nr:Uncharacterized protein AC511_0546 [Pseudomonas coronafaciens pv. oryzae]